MENPIGTKKVISIESKEEFIKNTIDFLVENQWTASNMNEALQEVSKIFEENATLTK
ncbi:TPA_asm: hypothetical protein GYP43_02855 [Listeria monocytogenes]|nr:hypothetical protein [Listeria monocytogenes]